MSTQVWGVHGGRVLRRGERAVSALWLLRQWDAGMGRHLWPCTYRVKETANLHWRRRTWVRTQIRIRNPMATLYNGKHVHIADPYFLFMLGQESKSESVPGCVSGNVNELWLWNAHSLWLWQRKTSMNYLVQSDSVKTIAKTEAISKSFRRNVAGHRQFRK